MIIHDAITVNAETSLESAEQKEYKLCKGVLTTVVILPAFGPNWEVFFRMLHLENSIIPDVNDDWIPLEREKLTFEPHFSDWKDVYKVKVEMCSPQAKYKHTVNLIITVLEIATAEQSLDKILQEGFR